MFYLSEDARYFVLRRSEAMHLGFKQDGDIIVHVPAAWLVVDKWSGKPGTDAHDAALLAKEIATRLGYDDGSPSLADDIDGISGTRPVIAGTISDLVADFLYYDRKEDETLPRGTIEEAIKEGFVSEAEIVGCFSRMLREALKRE